MKNATIICGGDGHWIARDNDGREVGRATATEAITARSDSAAIAHAVMGRHRIEFVDHDGAFIHCAYA